MNENIENVENTSTNDNLVTSNEQVKEPTRNEILREWSKENKMDLFDAKQLAAFKEFQNAQKTELEKLKETVTHFENTKQDYETKLFDKDVKITSLELGIDSSKINDAVTLAKSRMNDKVDLKQALSNVMEEYPHFKKQKNTTVEVGKQSAGQENTVKVDSPVLAAFKKKRNK